MVATPINGSGMIALGALFDPGGMGRLTVPGAISDRIIGTGDALDGAR